MRLSRRARGLAAIASLVGAALVAGAQAAPSPAAAGADAAAPDAAVPASAARVESPAAPLGEANAAPAAPPSAAAAAAPGSDCPPAPEPLSEADLAEGLRDAHDAGFLWKITKDGHASWLYGTLHVAQRAWMFPGPHVQAAMRASDAVALELDLSDPDVAARLQRAIAARPGAPALPPALDRRLRAQLVAACLAPEALAGLRPEMRAVTAEVLSGRRLGLQPAYGIDEFLGQLAPRWGKPLLSLETPESQAALLVSDDPRETARSVEDVLAELEDGRGVRVLGRLADDWHRGDLADLAAYAAWCGCLETAAQRGDFARLIDERNPAMARRIAEWHARGRSLFVAVGSLHMVGDIGLPALLRARGFQVERVAAGSAP